MGWGSQPERLQGGRTTPLFYPIRCFSQKRDRRAADMDGDTVMMSVEAGKYYNLGTTGGGALTLIPNWRAIFRVFFNSRSKGSLAK
jgi:hypothetical protein